MAHPAGSRSLDRARRQVRKSRSAHVGGQQMPMFVPKSTWTRPRELPDLRRAGEIALDRETMDLGLVNKRGPGWAFPGSAICGRIVGTSVAWMQEGKVRSMYLPVAHPDSDCFDREQVARWELDHQRAGVRFV